MCFFSPPNIVLNCFFEFTYFGGGFGYFLFFSAPGGERGSPRRRGVGFFLLKIPGGGVSRRGKGQGVGRASAANWGIGGGSKYFFLSGLKCPPSYTLTLSFLTLDPKPVEWKSCCRSEGSQGFRRLRCPSMTQRGRGSKKFILARTHEKNKKHSPTHGIFILA